MDEYIVFGFVWLKCIYNPMTLDMHITALIIPTLTFKVFIQSVWNSPDLSQSISDPHLKDHSRPFEDTLLPPFSAAFILNRIGNPILLNLSTDSIRNSALKTKKKVYIVISLGKIKFIQN